MKVLLLFCIFFVGCSHNDYQFAESQGLCKLSAEKIDIAWQNVASTMVKKYPEYSKLCELDYQPSENTFTLVGGRCRTYLACTKRPLFSTGYILHPDLFVYVNPNNLQVTEVTSVAW